MRLFPVQFPSLFSFREKSFRSKPWSQLALIATFMPQSTASWIPLDFVFLIFCSKRDSAPILYPPLIIDKLILFLDYRSRSLSKGPKDLKKCKPNWWACSPTVLPPATLGLGRLEKAAIWSILRWVHVFAWPPFLPTHLFRRISQFPTAAAVVPAARDACPTHAIVGTPFRPETPPAERFHKEICYNFLEDLSVVFGQHTCAKRLAACPWGSK